MMTTITFIFVLKRTLLHSVRNSNLLIQLLFRMQLVNTIMKIKYQGNTNLA